MGGIINHMLNNVYARALPCSQTLSLTRCVVCSRSFCWDPRRSRGNSESLCFLFCKVGLMEHALFISRYKIQIWNTKTCKCLLDLSISRGCEGFRITFPIELRMVSSCSVIPGFPSLKMWQEDGRSSLTCACVGVGSCTPGREKDLAAYCGYRWV